MQTNERTFSKQCEASFTPEQVSAIQEEAWADTYRYCFRIM